MGKGERRLKSERKGREVGKVPSRSPGLERKVAGVGGRAALRGPLGPAPRALRVCSRAGRPAAANGQSGGRSIGASASSSVFPMNIQN